MKRLFYATKTLADAHSISNEVHNVGIDDDHFYVVCRNGEDIKARKLHGSSSFEGTQLLAGKKRASFFAALLTTLVACMACTLMTFTTQNVITLAIVCALLFTVATFIATVAGNAFDVYFRGVFDDHLDAGESILIIDVAHDQADTVVDTLARHKLATFIADSSNIGSPIPH
jgi:hypothetical protein